MSVPREDAPKLAIYPGGHYWTIIYTDTWMVKAFWDNELIGKHPARVKHLDPMWWRLRYRLTQIEEEIHTTRYIGWRYVSGEQEGNVVGPAG